MGKSKNNGRNNRRQKWKICLCNFKIRNPKNNGKWHTRKSYNRYNRQKVIFWIYEGLINKLEKDMATHSSVLAWRIPGTGEPGELPSMGSYRVRHDWGDLAAAAAAGGRKDISMAYGSTGKNINSTSEDPKSIKACCYQAGPELALVQLRLPASVGDGFSNYLK